MRIRSDPDEIVRLKKKSNALIERVKLLQDESAAKDLEIAELRAFKPVQNPDKTPLNPRPILTGNFYWAFVQVLSRMLRNDEIIMPKLMTKNNRSYRHVEVAVFKARVTELLPGIEEKRFLEYCFAFGLLQRIGANISTVAHRRNEDEDAGATVRVYRLNVELIEFLKEELDGWEDGDTGDGVPGNCGGVPNEPGACDGQDTGTDNGIAG